MSEDRTPRDPGRGTRDQGRQPETQFKHPWMQPVYQAQDLGPGDAGQGTYPETQPLGTQDEGPSPMAQDPTSG